ncbi:MAG: plasmid mobilization relaxosome protein MobC [Burkholderiaceae bacterium]|nr:plasmid mobilization relaxosome protein MobC [Burkholderiaceae bacterium]
MNLYLGALKKPWSDYCEALGKKPGAALKEAIEQQLEKAAKNPTPPPLRQTGEAPDDEPKVRFEILMTNSEKTAVQERANLERCSQRRWVIDAIRAGLTHEPQFGMKEIEALGESNYQLLAIGRNLNQVAKAMNEGRRDSVTIESIERLRGIIDAHTERVSAAIRASVERWCIE